PHKTEPEEIVDSYITATSNKYHHHGLPLQEKVEQNDSIDYSDVNSYEEWQVWLVSIRIQSKLKGVLEGVYYGLWWYMWNFRNKLLFDKKIPEKALILEDILGVTIQKDIEEILRDTTKRDIEEILGDTTQRDIEEILGDTTQRDIGRYYPKRYFYVFRQ
ncbi:hypothetical protein Tco_1481804, partial [Tanacetum coccineum]